MPTVRSAVSPGRSIPGVAALPIARAAALPIARAAALPMARAAALPMACAAALLFAGCGAEPAVERGRALFADPAFSGSSINPFSCDTCHSTLPGGDPARRTAGYTLADTVRRPTWWGGGIRSLLDAASYCRTEFMRGSPLAESDEDGRALLVFLESISPSTSAPARPHTIVKDIPLALPRGDATRGRAIYDSACLECHGSPSTAAGRIAEYVPILPDATLAKHGTDPMTGAYRITISKVRNGKFYNIGGTMPLYSLEALSDGDLADALAYLGLNPP